MITDDDIATELAPIFKTLKHLKFLYTLKKLTSTNEFALDLEKCHQACGTVIVAAEQTGGHGRMRRQWHSLKGDIMMSILLRAKALPAELCLLPILPSLAMLYALRKLDVEVLLKWPNDIVFKSEFNDFKFDYFDVYKKLGGILVENVFKNNEISACIIGLGLNIKINPHLREIVPHCGFLEELDTTLRRHHVLTHFLVELDQLLGRAHNSNFADEIMADYVRHCATIGHQVVVRQGDTKVAGLAIGIDRDGSLVVKDGVHIHRIYAGELQSR